MLKVTKKHTVDHPVIVPEEQECTCDRCKKIIFRKKTESGCEHVNDYHKLKAEYRLKNPLEVTYYKLTDSGSILSTIDLCKDCLMKEIEDSLKMYDEISIEKVQTECFEGDVS